ncbi:MAG: DUF2845 domain-containing protein [Bryobacteraceae bacterium]|nr:DUF2845 domain-containing protein [Bryobacteraceae bacterium]MDW8378798.1 hypothetical protein [Bryobacterales bacterium]
MKKILTAATLGSFFLAGPAKSQSMLESATAAAGGSAAGVAGKKVSDGIDAVLGKLSGVAKAAASTGAQKDERRRLAAPIPPLPSVPAAAGAAPKPAPATPRSTLRRAELSPSKTKNLEAPPALAPTLVEPLSLASPPAGSSSSAAVPARNLSELSNGSSREDVLSRWGKPPGRLTTSNNEGLVEVYKYPEGSVRLVNGKVTEIRPAQP